MHGYIAKIFGNNIFKMTISTKNIFCYDYQQGIDKWSTKWK